MMLTTIGRTSIYIALCALLSGCIFEIESLYAFKYPIQPDGSVDLTLAPLEDIDNFTMRGFYARQFGQVELQAYCEDEFWVGVPWSGYRPLTDQVSTNTKSLYATGVNPEYPHAFLWPSCLYRETEDGHSEIRISVRANDLWVPILSEENMACISEKIHAEKLHYLAATMECLALDTRDSDNPLGLHPADEPPREINVLKLRVPVDY